MNDILKKLEAYYHSFLKSLPRLGMALLIIIAGILLAGWITAVFKKQLKEKSHDQLMSNFLAKAVKLALIIGIIMLALHVAGLSGIAGAIMATAGASAIVLGFAFKDIAENFLAGIILAFNRPFHIDDTVQIESVFGKVKAMEFRYTKITTFDGRNVYIPNSDVLTKPVFNYTEDGFYRNEFIVGIAYENDIEKAKQLIMDCINNEKEIVHDDVHANFVIEDELAASTVNFKVFFWITTQDFRRGSLQTKGRLIQNVKNRLVEEGFNLPANITELKFYDASSRFPVRTSTETKA